MQTRDSTTWTKRTRRRLTSNERKKKIVVISHRHRKTYMKTVVRTANMPTLSWWSSMKESSYARCVELCQSRDWLTSRTRQEYSPIHKECQMPLLIVCKQCRIATCSQPSSTLKSVETVMQPKSLQTSTTLRSMDRRRICKMDSARSDNSHRLYTFTLQM